MKTLIRCFKDRIFRRLLMLCVIRLIQLVLIVTGAVAIYFEDYLTGITDFVLYLVFEMQVREVN